MEEIKAPKKERKFLKAVGNIAKVLANELVMGIARKFIGKAIDKIGNKRQGLIIAFALVAGISYASIDSIPYPITGNKQRLGWQTTGNGLVWRGRVNDTITKPTSYADKNVKAYLILDSVSGSLYVFKQGAWAAITGAGGGLTMPFDSITFNTAKDGTVGVGEVEYNDTQGSLIQGLKGGNVTNVIGQQLHQRVKNRTGATLTKGTAVYLSGSQGNKITVAKALGVTNAFSANTFGIVAESIANNQSGYVITEGLITNINTSSLVEDSAVYLSPTVAGGLTSTKPQAPQHTVYIGVCVKSNAGSGELFCKIINGQELNELHDVRITSPVDKASLYYKSSEGLWTDTTATLLVSDTAAMLSNYALKSYADTSGRFYARQEFRNVSSSTLTWTQTDTLVVNDTTSLQVYRNGQILLPNQYTVPTKTTVVIAAASFKTGENYTVIFPRGGGGGGSGSGSLTSISGGTGITVSPNPITTTGTVSADLTVLMELTDTTLLNLTTRFATKQPNITLTTTGTSGAATFSSNTLNIPQYTGGSGTVTSVGSGYGLTGGPITTTGTLRVDTSTVYNFVRDSIVAVEIGGDTIKILKQEYTPATTDTLTWTVTSKFPIQLRQFILLFRNGQLLLNDQFSIIDTNKVKVAASSYKLGENYTLVTVSGIGSAGISQTGNPVYPEAGIALSTGTTWTTSITNNSSNWNTAFTDRLKWDGGSTDLVPSTGRTSLGGTTIGQSMFTLTNPSAITFPRFNTDNTVTALTANNFRAAISAGTVTEVDASATAGNPISITNKTSTPIIELLSATSGRNGYLTSTDWTTFNNKQNALSNASASVSGILTSTDWTTFNNKQNTISLTTNGTSGLATFNGTTLNIPNYTSSGGGTGTVTSVGLTAPSIFTVSGSPVTTIGTLALTYSGTALPLANGGTGATTTDAALTNFGATAMGKSLFGLTNSVSDKFIKVNANNTITLLDGADTRAAIGAGNITGNGVSEYFSIFGSSTYISQSLLRWDGNTIPNSTLISDYNFNSFGGALSVTGATTLSNLAGTGTRMVVASSTGLLSTQSIATSVTSFSAGSTGLTPSTATTGAVTLDGTLAVANGGTGGTTAATARTSLGATSRGSGTFMLPDISQVSFVRYNANNTVSQRTAEGIRLDLGGTTIGQNMFMLTNPSAITFPRYNADNTVSALSASDFRTAIGVGSGGSDPNLYIALNGPTIVLSASMGSQSTYFLHIDNVSTVTVTLPTASLNTNKSITIKNGGSGAVNSNTTNVQRLTGSTSNVILLSGGGKWATLVSDGYNWITMAAN